MYSTLPIVLVLSLVVGNSVALAAETTTPPPFEAIVPPFPTVTFSNAVLPGAFAAGPGGRVSIVGDRFKSKAMHGLRFDWDEPGASFTWTDPEAFAHITGADPDPIVYDYCLLSPLSTFNVWVFNEHAVDDRVWFEIGTVDRVDVRFYMNLNFSGWKRLSALYGRDMRALPGPGADTLRIIAPASLPKGSLWFDELEPNTPTDTRSPQLRRSLETPWVDNPEAAAAGAGECIDPAIAKFDPPAKVEIPTPETLTEAEMALMKTLTDRYLARFTTDIKQRDVSDVELSKWRALYDQHQPVRKGRWVSGQVGNARTFWSNVGQLVKGWAVATQPAVREELRSKIFDLLDLVAQQGFHAYYGANAGYLYSLLPFRAELEATKRWDPLLRALGESYELDKMTDRDVWGNADIYITMMHGQLGLLLLAPDGPQKWRDLMAFRRFLDVTSAGSEIKPDGSFFHHHLTYSGYGIPAIQALTDVLLLLKGTPFFPERMHEAARRVALAMRFYSCGLDMPDYASGRHRGNGRVNPSLYRDLAECGNPATGEAVDREMAAFYLWYVKDADAARYKELGIRIPSSEKSSPADFDPYRTRYLAMGIEPLQPTGNLTLPYSVASFQRRDDWLVAVHGQRAEFQAAEAYPVDGSNTMGRYIAFGQTYIHSKRLAPGDLVTAKASGFEAPKNYLKNGWDFNRWPGTTARVIPYDALRSHFLVEEMMTAETFALGTSLDGNGMFAMKLQEELPGAVDPRRIGPCRWWLGETEYQKRVQDSAIDPSFRARKSWFFFDDCVVSLGSGITCEDTRYPINTTLFQNMLNLPGKRERFALDGASSAVFPLDDTLAAADRSHWLMDSSDNGYWVPAGNDTLHILRKERALPYHAYWTLDFIKTNPPDDRPTGFAAKQDVLWENTGEVELAWFNHGAAPAKPAGYEYAIVVDTTASRMRDFAQAPRYRVLRKDNTAHVVYDVPTRTTGYALFEANVDVTIPGTKPNLPSPRSVSSPCVLMLRETAPGAYRMSFADSDMGLRPVPPGPEATYRDLEWWPPGGTPEPVVSQVTLNGRWNVQGAGVKVIASEPDQTVVEYRSVDGKTVVVELTAVE